MKGYKFQIKGAILNHPVTVGVESGASKEDAAKELQGHFDRSDTITFIGEFESENDLDFDFVI